MTEHLPYDLSHWNGMDRDMYNFKLFMKLSNWKEQAVPMNIFHLVMGYISPSSCLFCGHVDWAENCKNIKCPRTFKHRVQLYDLIPAYNFDFDGDETYDHSVYAMVAQDNEKLANFSRLV